MIAMNLEARLDETFQERAELQNEFQAF